MQYEPVGYLQKQEQGVALILSLIQICPIDNYYYFPKQKHVIRWEYYSAMKNRRYPEIAIHIHELD